MHCAQLLAVTDQRISSSTTGQEARGISRMIVRAREPHVNYNCTHIDTHIHTYSHIYIHTCTTSVNISIIAEIIIIAETA